MTGPGFPSAMPTKIATGTARTETMPARNNSCRTGRSFPGAGHSTMILPNGSSLTFAKAAGGEGRSLAAEFLDRRVRECLLTSPACDEGYGPMSVAGELQPVRWRALLPQ